jgi:hypothetical protein
MQVMLSINGERTDGAREQAAKQSEQRGFAGATGS